MNRTISVVLVIGVAVGALVGCSGKSDTVVVSSTQSASSSAATTIEAAPQRGDQTQDGLEAALDEQWALAQSADWAGIYDFSSPRCQVQYSVEEFVAALDDAYADRDFSGTPEYLINMNGDSVATVVIKAPDGKSPMTPGTWSYINGSWYDDDC